LVAREPVSARSPRAVLQELAQESAVQFRSAEAAELDDCLNYFSAARHPHAQAAQFSPREAEQQ